MPTFDTLATPAVLVDRTKLAANIQRMQATCTAHGVELRPHLKTHKMVAVAKQQLEAGAKGLTCAKLGEAEAMLPSGVRHLFVAHSLVDPGQAARIAALAERLDDFRVAVTSEVHLEALLRVARAAGRKLDVMLALDTGLGREGARDGATAARVATLIARSGQLTLRGFYTHEGNFYGLAREELSPRAAQLIETMDSIRDAIDPTLPIWPGCSVTAAMIASTGAGRVQAVRPGSYVFGDLSLSQVTGIMPLEAVALQILATVVDRPEPGLALIDAGSKTFSSDRTPAGIHGIAADGRDLSVARVNEEHGYLRGAAVDTLRVGERVALIPAHVCTVINLTDEVIVTDNEQIVTRWPVDARGCTK